MSGSDVRVLVMAKAPVAGLAKTRLAASVGDDAAADLAAAALLDTLAAAAAAAGPSHCLLALTGDLDAAARAADLRRALVGWRVIPQRGDGFDERLALAHADAGVGPVVQVGMDTPQVTADLLLAAAAPLAQHDTVLGRADDGGWWVLARTDPRTAQALRGVEMSSARTYELTLAALRDAGHSVGSVPSLLDVDTRDDAKLVATAAPATLFGRAWGALQSGQPSDVP